MNILLIGELSLSIHALISICFFTIVDDRYPKYKKFKSFTELYIILIFIYFYSLFILSWVNKYKDVEINILEALIVSIFSFICIKPLVMLNEYVYENGLSEVYKDSIFIRIVYPLSMLTYASMYIAILFI